jgi:hypothetical protein
MVMPSFELMSLGMVALGLGVVLSRKENSEKKMLKCKRCGTKEMRAKSGMIICKNGHRVTGIN